jgi:hypothetical protein
MEGMLLQSPADVAASRTSKYTKLVEVAPAVPQGSLFQRHLDSVSASVVWKHIELLASSSMKSLVRH